MATSTEIKAEMATEKSTEDLDLAYEKLQRNYEKRQRAVEKYSDQREAHRSGIEHFEETSETAQKTPRLKAPDVASGGTGAVRAALDDLCETLKTEDFIALATANPDSNPLPSKLSPVGLTLFALRQTHTTWSLESLELINRACSHHVFFDWVRMAWTGNFGGKTALERGINTDMLRLREMNPYECLHFIYVNFTKSTVAMAFIDAFVAQEGIFGAAFLYALHTTIEFGIHLPHTHSYFNLGRRAEDWFIPAGSAIVKAFYDYNLGGDCKYEGRCKTNYADLTTYTLAYGNAFVPKGVYYYSDYHNSATSLVNPPCQCTFSLKKTSETTSQ